MTAPNDFPDFAQATNPPFPLTSISNAEGAVNAQNVPLPQGTRFISLTNPTPLSSPTITMDGHITGAPYTNSFQPATFLNYPTQWFLIDPADTSVDISLGATPEITLWVGGSISPVAVALNVNEDVLAQLVDSQGANIGSWSYPPGGLSDSQIVLAAGLPDPLPWQAAGELPARINQSISSTGTFQLIAPPGAGARLWLHSINVELNEPANAAGTFDYGTSTSSHTPFHGWQMGGGGGSGTSGVGKSYPIPLHAAPLPLNNGLYLVVSAAASGQTMTGSVAYSIG